MHRPVRHDPYRASALLVPQFETAEPWPEREGPLRIVSVVDRYPPWINAGAEWMLHSILRRMVEVGHDCRVSTAMPGDVVVPFNYDGVMVYPYDAAESLVEEADVLIGHLLWTREIVGMARDAGKPLMYLLHNDRQIHHWNLDSRNVTVLVPNSEWVARSALDGGWRGPTMICRPPVFCADYAPKRVTRPGREFVTMVNPIPEKGAIQFYELARHLYDLKFRAVTGAYGHQHRPPYYIDNAELIPATANMGADVYAKASVILVPSEYESWGRVAVEAMAAGVPVIAHPTPGLVEACGEGAHLIDREDGDAWQRTIRRLVTDADYWREWSHRGRARAAELEDLTDRDLLEFERWARMCAAIPVPEKV